MRTRKATKSRIKMGQKTDNELMSYLRENPDRTIYELSKELNWSTGKVQKSVKRLNKKLVIAEEIRRGRLRKKYRAIE